MRTSEKVIIAIFSLAVFLKLLLIPNSETLLTLIYSIVLMYYSVFGFAVFNNISLKQIIHKTSYQNIATSEIFGGVFAGLGVMAFNVPIAFILYPWPGSELMISSSLFMGSIPLSILLVKYLIKKKIQIPCSS